MPKPLHARSLGVVVVLATLVLQLGCGMVAGLTGEDVNQGLRASGLPAEATVVEIWDTGVSVNDDPVVGFRLEVRAPGRVPWTVEARQLVSQLAIPRIQPGAVLAVRYDPAAPSRVAIMTAAHEAPPPAPPEHGPDLGPDIRIEPLADLAAWPATLAAIEAAYPDARVVVPGHGAAGGRELLTHTRALLAEHRPPG